jgi:hypothetical protein
MVGQAIHFSYGVRVEILAAAFKDVADKRNVLCILQNTEYPGPRSAVADVRTCCKAAAHSVHK